MRSIGRLEEVQLSDANMRIKIPEQDAVWQIFAEKTFCSGFFVSLPDGVGRCIKPAPSLVPRQLPNPVAVVGFQKGGHAFKNLICVQTPDHDGRGCMHHKRHEKRQRQDDAPDADQVHFDDEKCVPAAADDAVIGGHLISHADADDTQDDEKSICHFLCGRLQIVDREDRDTDEKQCNAGQYTNA